jgi:ribosomal protein S18 acetylase RimI-like enzyme
VASQNAFVGFRPKSSAVFTDIQFFNDLMIDLIAAATGGSITLAVDRTRRWLINRRLERLYPIAGEYISTFEDQLNGSTTMISAYAKLDQSGTSLKGTTRVGDRSWILEGNITEDNYIYGRYDAESPYDKGNGNFYLEICPEGVLKGLWSGFANMNKTIEVGAYSFKKVIAVTIEPNKKSFMPGIIRVSQHQLGDLLFIKEPNLHGATDLIGYCALYNGRVIGFCLGRIIPSNDFLNRYSPIALCMPHEIIDHEERVGFASAIAVEDNMKGRGIGTKLMQTLINRFDTEGINVSLLSGWNSPKGLHITGIARLVGFEVIREIEDFYKDGSINNGYRCQICGPPPCRCSAVIMMRTK